MFYNSTNNFEYTLTDHASTTLSTGLGSITAIVNEQGNIVEEQSFDAWGRNRNPSDWSYDNAQPISLLFRGYTGHEMLPEFGLINMNGRMYDPVLGRMLSPDNYVQDPFFPQNYNRYAYCWNNPLKYTDPSGEYVGFAVMIGVWFGASVGLQISESKGATGWESAGYIVGGSVIGGVSAYAGASLGLGIGQMQFLSSGLVGSTIGSGISGGFSSAGYSALYGASGTDVLDAFWKGGVTGLAGGFVGGVVPGSFGAFLGGATSGVVGKALNDNSDFSYLEAGLLGGAVAWGGYKFQQSIAYSQYIEAGGNWTFKQYRQISRYTQESFGLRRREASIRIDARGNVVFDKWGPKYTKLGGEVTHSFYLDDQYVIHTHAKLGKGFSNPDRNAYANIFRQVPHSKIQFSVVGKNSIYITNISGNITTVNAPAFAFPHVTSLILF